MANRLSEIDWFLWNGVKCTDYGMHVLVQPSILRASERVSYETVPGRSGSLTVLEGNDIYDDITLSCTCIIDDPYENVNGESVSRIAKICGWLRGNGKVTFANRQEGFYEARVANQISFDQIVQGNPHRSFQVQFRCKPFLYLYSGQESVTYTSTTLLTNPGNIPAAPLLKIRGAGEGTIMCGGSTMLINGFEGIDYISLDCEAKIAYKGTPGDPNDPLMLLGTRVTGEWLTIPTGRPYFTIAGDLSSVEVTPRWRCL